MNINEVKQLIAKDESRVLELKTSTGELVKGMQTLCAFLNSDGGWLFFRITPMVEACKNAGLPEPVYDTDGSFVWITFMRPNSNTNSNTNSDTNSDTNSVTNSITNSDTNSVTNLVASDGKGLSDRQKEILMYCMVARSSREILEHVGVTYQFKNIDKFINSLVDAGLLERTIPESPNSPKQKYITNKSRKFS